MLYVLEVDGGLGMPVTTLSSDEMATFLKVCQPRNNGHAVPGKVRANNDLKGTFAIEVIYYSIVFCIKSSVIFMYHRFGNTSSLSIDSFLTWISDGKE
jgi:hypothetical protein